jgi:hypothetical protein
MRDLIKDKIKEVDIRSYLLDDRTRLLEEEYNKLTPDEQIVYNKYENYIKNNRKEFENELIKSKEYQIKELNFCI